MTIEEAKIIVCEAGKRLLKEGLVARTWGNISVRLNEREMVITPSGKHYDDLKPEDMVLVNFKTNAASGIHKPSSEYKLHAAIYNSRSKVGSVIHTHQMNASTVAAAHREIPPILDDQAQLLGPSVKVAPYALPNTNKLTKATLKALKGRNAALMANHGAVCVGRDLEEAFVCCQVLEKAAKAFIEASFLGGAKSINKVEAWVMHKYYLMNYSKKAKNAKG